MSRKFSLLPAARRPNENKSPLILSASSGPGGDAVSYHAAFKEDSHTIRITMLGVLRTLLTPAHKPGTSVIYQPPRPDHSRLQSRRPTEVDRTAVHVS